MSSTPPVDGRERDTESESGPGLSESSELPGTDDLEQLLGTNPAVQRSRERQAKAAAEPPEPPPASVADAAPPTVPSTVPPTVPPLAPEPQPTKTKRTFTESVWAWLYPAALVILALLIPVFGLMGYNAILDSSDGDVTPTVTDPAAPGYEVLVEPTPVTMMALVEGDVLVGVNVTSLALDDVGGTMMWLPPNTLVDGEDLAAVYADGGSAALRDAVAGELTIDVGEVEVIDNDRWASLVAPVAPILIDLPDALVLRTLDGTTVVEFPSGQVALEPDQVGPYLAWLNPGEREINRLARQQGFFDAWLGQIAASDDPGAVPGEVDSGLGRFIRGVSSGPAITETLPVTPVIGEEDVVEVTDTEAVAVIVTAAVPLPISPFPGVRPVIKLLDGVGDQPRTLASIEELVLGGGQISVLGNNETFDVAATEIRYHVPEAEEAAERLADSLGVGLVSFVPTTTEGETVVIEVTVVIGIDYEPAGVPE